MTIQLLDHQREMVLSMAREYASLSRSLFNGPYNQELDLMRSTIHGQLSDILGIQYESFSGDELIGEILGITL